MKKIKLKKNKSKANKIVIIIVLIIATLFIAFNYIGKTITPVIINYAEKQAKKIAIQVISSAVDEEITSKFDTNKLFIINNDETDYNTVEISKILKSISLNVKEYLNKLEQGKIKDIGLSNNINVDEKKLKNGIIYQVPSGIIFNNGLLSNLGPKIPVKLSFIGDIVTDVVTNVKEYGINNAIIELLIKVSAEEQVILPFDTKQIKIESLIPVSIKIIKGEVPSYYLNPYTIPSK